VFVCSIRLRICAAPAPHVRFSLGEQLSTGQVVRSSLYFESSLPCGQSVCLNYFVGSSALLKDLYTPVFCCSGDSERTVITIIAILLQGLALYLAVCGAVRNFGVSFDKRGSTVGNCRYNCDYLFLPLTLLYLLNEVFFIFFS